MKSKFNTLYKQIISENKIVNEWSYYRRKHPKSFTIEQIIGATKQITEDCKGQWIKGQTGQQVQNICFNNEIQGTTNPSQVEYIRSFWDKKSTSGNLFDKEIANILAEKEIDQFSSGKAAYGIFIALNNRYKEQNGLIEPNKGQFVGEPGQKITLNLKYDKCLSSRDGYGFGWVHKNGFWAHPNWTSYIFQLSDEQGNIFICKTSSDNVAKLIKDLKDYSPVKCSIINHKVFRDTNQTEIYISAPRAKKIKVVNSETKPEGDKIPEGAEVQLVDELDDLIPY